MTDRQIRERKQLQNKVRELEALLAVKISQLQTVKEKQDRYYFWLEQIANIFKTKKDFLYSHDEKWITPDFENLPWFVADFKTQASIFQHEFESLKRFHEYMMRVTLKDETLKIESKARNMPDNTSVHNIDMQHLRR